MKNSTTQSNNTESSSYHDGKPQEPSVPNVNLSNLLLTKPASPSNVLGGIKSGLKTMGYCLVSGVAIVVALPIKFGLDAYEKSGWCGAIGGGIVGITLGMVGGVIIICGGVFNFLWQVLLGIFRTPSAIYHSCHGKYWDEDAEEWNNYNLEIEKEKIFDVSEDEFLRRYVQQKQKYGHDFSPFSINKHTQPNSTMSGGVSTLHDADMDMERPKKVIADRELYDILGVEPEATSSEIKKAYYLKARQNHPDRNPNNSGAKENFQRIGQAYQILGDESLRQDYDSRGKIMVESTPNLDAAMFYSLLFGSDIFEMLVGELQMVTFIRLATDDSSNKKDSIPNRGQIVLQYRQRKREFLCAKALCSKLDFYVSGDLEGFKNAGMKDCDEMVESDNKMGSLLLAFVGSIYLERAKAYLYLTERIRVLVTKPFRLVSKSLSLVSVGSKVVASGLDMKRIVSEAEQLQKDEDERNGVPHNPPEMHFNLNAFYGPNPSAERKALVEAATKKFTERMIYLLWEVMKDDVRTTLKNVCYKVLHDHSVSEETRDSRAEGLLILGEMYYNHVVEEQQSLDHLVTKLGQQSGLFGSFEYNNSGSPKKGPDASGVRTDGNNNPLSKERMEELIILLKSEESCHLSVKELKNYLDYLQEDHSQFIEKSEMKSHLLACLESKISS